MPLVRLLIAVGAMGFADRTARTQDVAWIKATAKRFNSEMGIVKPRFLGGSGATETTSMKERLYEHILLGETQEAKALIRGESAKFKNPKDRKKFLDGLEASVRNKQPINAGPGGGEPARELFLRWAKKNLHPDELDRVQRIDQEYRRTATERRLSFGTDDAVVTVVEFISDRWQRYLAVNELI
jgi:hypothetical protein